MASTHPIKSKSGICSQPQLGDTIWIGSPVAAILETCPVRSPQMGLSLDALFSIPGKWFLASRPILSFRPRAYRQPAPDQAECQTLLACPARSEISTLQTCLPQSEQTCPPQSAGSFDHNMRGDHWPSVPIGIARFERPQPVQEPQPTSDRRTQSGRPKRSEFSTCSSPFSVGLPARSAEL